MLDASQFRTQWATLDTELITSPGIYNATVEIANDSDTRAAIRYTPRVGGQNRAIDNSVVAIDPGESVEVAVPFEITDADSGTVEVCLIEQSIYRWDGSQFVTDGVNFSDGRQFEGCTTAEIRGDNIVEWSCSPQQRELRPGDELAIDVAVENLTSEPIEAEITVVYQGASTTDTLTLTANGQQTATLRLVPSFKGSSEPNVVVTPELV